MSIPITILLLRVGAIPLNVNGDSRSELNDGFIPNMSNVVSTFLFVFSDSVLSFKSSLKS